VRHPLSLLLAAPWVIVPLVTMLRARNSRSLDDESNDESDDESDDVADPAPTVSIVIPARNEARNISRCVRSALAADYPRLEVVVVDDHSTDGTSAIVHELAATDSRLRIVTPPPLPHGWFGKQWACWTGAGASSGQLLLFVDADTWQATDLVPRGVAAMTARNLDLLSVAGTQELGSFWERLVQPQMFSILLARFGGTESVNESRLAEHKIANGQCLFFRREAYEALDGHAAVRDKVAEDLALAQRFFAEGRRTALVLGLSQLSTRMYTSLGELVEGWGKNIYAGGREAMPRGIGRVLYPLLLLVPALAGLVPALLLALSLGGLLGPEVLLWSSIATGANLVWWLLVYWWLALSPLYALLHPLGSAVLLYISLRAIVRGQRVRWKGRDYVTS
jgi:chlorobactene glucosyltransferase